MARLIGRFPGFTERLVETRKQLGLTQKELAANLGISLNSYLRTENDQRLMTVDELARLAEFGVDAGWLLTGIHSSFAGSAPSIDRTLFNDVVTEVAKLHAEEKQELNVSRHNLIALDIYEGVVGIEGTEARRGALQYAIEQLRAGIRKARTDQDQSKRHA